MLGQCRRRRGNQKQLSTRLEFRGSQDHFSQAKEALNGEKRLVEELKMSSPSAAPTWYMTSEVKLHCSFVLAAAGAAYPLANLLFHSPISDS